MIYCATAPETGAGREVKRERRQISASEALKVIQRIERLGEARRVVGTL